MMQHWPKIVLVLSFIVVIGVPFAFRPTETAPEPDALRLVIITPHNEQIRTEFELGFDRWHQKKYGRSVRIDWRIPGGTSEIRKQLFAEYQAAIDNGPIQPGSMSYDLLFGGGSYEHGKMKTVFTPVGENKDNTWSATISQPVEFSQSQLDAWYGPNEIGRNTLYDPDHQWFGTALSAFGIVFNRDVLRELQVDDPTTWNDLTNPKLQGWVALADPGQSGSICTTFEVILQRAGWRAGWRILREAAANSRYFANSSSKVPIDVSLGEAAAGMCIDFYGRYQSQSIKDAGGGDRVGYTDPPKMTDIDPDPISLLTGAPHPELARRFIEYCLSVEGQALWQFPVVTSDDPEALGPRRFELRRMPVRRIMYRPEYFDHFVDKVNPFQLAEPVKSWNYDVRTFIPALFSAMAIDNRELLREAWSAINSAGPNHPHAARMRELFNAMPDVELTDPESGALETYSLDSAEHLAMIKAAWKQSSRRSDLDRIRWTTFFRRNYREIVDLASE